MSWEDRFQRHEDYLFGRAPAHVLAENPWLWSGAQTALCVADGEGRNGVYLAGQGLRVSSFDVAPTAVDRARALAAEQAVTLDTEVSTWENWDWSATFDLTVAIFVQFMSAADQPRQFANLRSATRPGGRLLLHGYRPEQVKLGTGGPQDTSQLYTGELLQEHFGDWQIERLAFYEREQSSGCGHVGRAALIDLVVRRPEAV